jgi:hypothetical protein
VSEFMLVLSIFPGDIFIILIYVLVILPPMPPNMSPPSFSSASFFFLSSSSCLFFSFLALFASLISFSLFCSASQISLASISA